MEMTCKTIPEVASTQSQSPADRQTTIIPKFFWVGGLKYGVDLEEILVENGKVIGTVQYANQRIVVDPSLAPIQTTEQSFIHELVHLMFHMCCEIELQRNERLVDVFSQFLYQALTTAEPRPISDLYPATQETTPADLEDDGPGYLHAPDFNYDEPFFVPIALLVHHGEDTSESEAVIEESDDSWDWDEGHDYNMPTQEEIDAMKEAHRRDRECDYAEERELELMEEEESRIALREEMTGWMGYADSWAAAHEDGWFYGDD